MRLRAPACSDGRVGYDLSHCMTPNNKPKPISGASMRLWVPCRGCSVVSAAARFSLQSYIKVTLTLVTSQQK